MVDFPDLDEWLPVPKHDSSIAINKSITDTLPYSHILFLILLHLKIFLPKMLMNSHLLLTPQHLLPQMTCYRL